MEVLKGFPQGGCGWKSYFFYVRLDQASVAVECLPSFMRLWGAGGNMLNDHSLLFILPVFFNSSISVLRSFCSTQPHSSFSLRAAVEAHRSRFSSSIDNAMEASFEDTSLSTVYVTGRSSGRGSLDAEEDGEPIRPSFGSSSVATYRPSGTIARSLRSDRALVRARSLRSDRAWL
ncbi:hypothetical protein HID58_094372, partial [Brassica napus]